MKRKSIPSILMLSAAAVTVIIVYFRDLGLKTMLIALLCVLVIFYFLGSVIEMVLNRFDEENNQKVADEGEVIEKENSPGEEGANGEEPEHQE